MGARLLRFVRGGKPARISPAELHAYSQVRKSEDEELAELDAKEKRKEEAEKLTTFVIVASLIALYWVGCR